MLAQIVVLDLVVCVDEEPSKTCEGGLKHEQTKENSENSETIQIYTIPLGSIFTIPQGNTKRQGPVSQFVFPILKQEERVFTFAVTHKKKLLKRICQRQIRRQKTRHQSCNATTQNVSILLMRPLRARTPQTKMILIF